MPIGSKAQQTSAVSTALAGPTAKRIRRTLPFPYFSLEQSLEIAQSIADNNAGKPYPRLSLAESLSRSPESSQFRRLITTSALYGLTEGGQSAMHIGLTSLGMSIVAPRDQEERRLSLIRAALNIDLFKRIYEHFNQHKLPPEQNFKNVLIRDYNVDSTLADDCIKNFLSDGRLTGLITHKAGGERVDLTGANQGVAAPAGVGHDDHSAPMSLVEDDDEAADRELTPLSLSPNGRSRGNVDVTNQRVFVTHGKNQEVVSQIKELLRFGKFEPVVAEEHETPSVPVPDKVMDEMRSCFAGVIHVESEQDLQDAQGNTHHKINENVLIEIGAALALYRRNVVLLVQRGLHLPSNLQGLYRCEYSGSELGYESTMKLLKVFSEFK